jgi:hypothetical protein
MDGAPATPTPLKMVHFETSASSDSNTAKAVRELCPFKEYEIINLIDLKSSPYEYDKSNEDDFLKVAEMMSSAENLILALIASDNKV